VSTAGQAGTAARNQDAARSGDARASQSPGARGPVTRPVGQGSQGGQGPGSRVSGPGSATGQSAAQRSRAPRRVKLTMSRLDPWSVMKISFLLSVAAGIAFVVAIAVLWLLLSGMGVFADVNRTVGDIVSNEASGSTFDIMDYIGFGRVVSLAVVIGVIDVILATAMATLGAFLYNVCSALVGGLQVTLSDD
jgi:hypothetical protein